MITLVFTSLQNFDRELCTRQLRYSGMMETIRIRRAGYPIRHVFSEFVDRYRLLVSGIKPPHMEDCRKASLTICQAVLGGADFQLGKTKVFLKDAQDAFLEQERDRVLTRKLIAIQKAVRGWHYRRKFRKMKSSCVTLQRFYKGYAERRRYEHMRQGYMRLQALYRSRQLTHRFTALRGRMINLQRHCRGFMARQWYMRRLHSVIVLQSGVRKMIAQKKYTRAKLEYRKRLEAEKLRKETEEKLKRQMNAKKAKEEAERLHRERLARIEQDVIEEEQAREQEALYKKQQIAEAEKRRRVGPVDDSQMVDEIFGFIDSQTESESTAPSAFKVCVSACSLIVIYASCVVHALNKS